MSTAEAPGRLHLGYRLDAGVAVVTVTGEVDLVTCGVLRDGLLRTVTDDNGRGLVVNLAEVSFLDSTGLGVLVGVWHRVEASGGRLAVAAPSRIGFSFAGLPVVPCGRRGALARALFAADARPGQGTFLGGVSRTEPGHVLSRRSPPHPARSVDHGAFLVMPGPLLTGRTVI